MSGGWSDVIRQQGLGFRVQDFWVREWILMSAPDPPETLFLQKLLRQTPVTQNLSYVQRTPVYSSGGVLRVEGNYRRLRTRLNSEPFHLVPNTYSTSWK